jgi:glycosyltransferase involved in cell wall biosynthesis
MTYSLVIASYRYGHLAAHAIESALSQYSFLDTETAWFGNPPDSLAISFDKIYFVDDGAGDCTHLPKLYPQVEFILREKNIGIVDNFQDMLNRVQTDYVMFLGADNWLRSDTLFELSQYKEDIITYNIMVTGELKEEIARLYPHTTSKSQFGDIRWKRPHQHHGSMMYRVSKAKEVGGYEKHRPDGERTDEDYALWDKMTEAGATIKYVDDYFLYYRRHRENFNKY